jgi:hypothetical protein
MVRVKGNEMRGHQSSQELLSRIHPLELYPSMVICHTQQGPLAKHAHRHSECAQLLVQCQCFLFVWKRVTVIVAATVRA